LGQTLFIFGGDLVQKTGTAPDVSEKKRTEPRGEKNANENVRKNKYPIPTKNEKYTPSSKEKGDIWRSE